MRSKAFNFDYLRQLSLAANNVTKNWPISFYEPDLKRSTEKKILS